MASISILPSRRGRRRSGVLAFVGPFPFCSIRFHNLCCILLTVINRWLNPCYSEHVGVSKCVRPAEILNESVRLLPGCTLAPKYPSHLGYCNLQLKSPLLQNAGIDLSGTWVVPLRLGYPLLGSRFICQ